jgi:uncharacterized membrane protein YdjX (TVP38/TMEM64 family)
MKRYVVDRGIAALFWAAVVGALMYAGASWLEMDQPGIMAILAALGAAVYVLFFCLTYVLRTIPMRPPEIRLATASRVTTVS